MNLTKKMTRNLIEEVLSRGISVTLDIAGSFIPGWAVVKPIVEKVLKDLPGGIAGKYISSEDDVDRIIDAFEKNDVLLLPITKAFQEIGITEEWADKTISLLQKVSDDVIESLANQKQQTQQLDTITTFLEEAAKKKSARLELRAQNLEYTDHLMMPENWMEGWQLAPGSVLVPSLSGRQLPLGAMSWCFQIMNSGEQLAVIKHIDLLVEEELQCPDETTLSGAKPGFDSYEEIVTCKPGAKSYALFKDKRLKYAPEFDVDDFKIHINFSHSEKIIQKIKLAIIWEDGTGVHVTYGPSLFICANESR